MQKDFFALVMGNDIQRKMYQALLRWKEENQGKKKARDGIRTRDPRLGKAILHH